MANPFEVLGVTRQSSDADIKAAFKAKAKQTHPDANPGDPTAEERFKEVSEAYEKLKDGKAATYQEERPSAGRQPPNMHPGAAGFWMDLDDMQEQMRQHMRRQRGRNDDIGMQHVISLDDAYSGTKVKVGINFRRGFEEVDVVIPAGVDSPTRLRVSGAGQDTDPAYPNGDLYVTVLIAQHPTLMRDGANLITIQDIDMWTAMLGGKIKVQTIKGTAVEVTVPRGVDHGSQLRVAGYGMPKVGVKNAFGDMIVALKVNMGPRLNDDQFALVQAARSCAPAPVGKVAEALAVLRS